MGKKIKYITLSDIHLGNKLNKTENIVRALREFFRSNDKEIKTYDMIVLVGDVFDRLLNNSSTDYLLITSLKDKFTYVYEYKNGWELEYKWSSTVGKLSTPTIKGVFSVGIKYPAIGGNTSSVKYATNIVDDYYYHSIIYDDKGFNIKDDRLGVAISHGCIRLATSSAKWIYDNIPEGTPIIIN